MSGTIGASSPGAIALDLERLRGGGRVLYVAAHPDDENTRLISYLTGARRLRVGYLSLTRGEGGQNRIGGEQGKLLGVLRTQELMGARGVDLGEQFFSRAVDFGYSKSAEETLQIWGHDAVLEDVVRVVRSFRPHVIVTRFPPKGDTHGHHLSSARLAHEAFTAAADPARFPEQVETLGVWQAERLVYNQIPRWLDPASETGTPLDVSGYVTELGLSLGEISAASRSMHRTQGFGAMSMYGPVPEYFALLAGKPFKDDPFSGLHEDWNGASGSGELAKALDAAVRAFNPATPPAVIPHLAKAHRAAAGITHGPLRRATQEQLAELMLRAAALRLDVRAPRVELVAGEPVELELHADPRLDRSVKVVSVTLPITQQVVSVAAPAERFAVQSVKWNPPADAQPVSPPWWSGPPTSEAWRPAPLTATFALQVGDIAFTVDRPVRHVWDDPVQGERSSWAQITPPVTVTPEAPVAMVPNGEPVVAYVEVRNHLPGFRGSLRLELPTGWRAAPDSIPLAMGERGEVQRHGFEISAPNDATRALPQQARVLLTAQGIADAPTWQRASLDYPHLPPVVLLEPTDWRLVPVQLELGKLGTVGYVPGSGDAVGELLSRVGVTVEQVSDETLARGDLGRYQAIVFGVRALNVRPELGAHHRRLMDYVAQGGTLLVQYNTNNRIDPLNVPLGPHPFVIGRARVTHEEAPMQWSDAQHPVLHDPHVLGQADFDGWVQERGLYFAESWDSRYATPLSLNDPGEDASAGALLIGKHGRGTFIYTGLSLFRQLPAGVPGAYRLLINLLSQGEPR